MLIIEGPDSIGKTRAAQRLLQLVDAATDESLPPESQFPIRYEHMGRPSKAFNFFGDYRDMIARYSIMDRFHLGALVWHEGVMNVHRLRIIEGWLLSEGSVIVVMAADSDEHYESMLTTDTKQQMFDRDTLIAANNSYLTMAVGDHELNPYIDHTWSSTPGDVYPSDEILMTWWNSWVERLKELGR